MASSHNATEQSRSLLGAFRRDGYVPLGDDRHKGQAGRVLVVGGCEEYTGAPYFAAMSALHSGADLAFIVCTRNAAVAIKSYSPELIVYPSLPSAEDDLDDDKRIEAIVELLPKLNAVAVGPGLGRDERVQRAAKRIVEAVLSSEDGIPLLLDADGLFLLQNNIRMLQNAKGPVVITPNGGEFPRLVAAATGTDVPSFKEREGEDKEIEAAVELCRALGPTVVVVRKGASDRVVSGQHFDADAEKALVCTEAGSLRRCGGQGDVLSGAILEMLAMQHISFTRNHVAASSSDTAALDDLAKLDWRRPAWVACVALRHASALAFRDKRRAMVASDVLSHLGEAWEHLYPGN